MEHTPPVVAGQRVTLVLGESSLIRAALYLYGAPLLGILLGAGISQALLQTSNDAVSLVSAAIGLGAGGWAGAFLARRDACMADIKPAIGLCLDGDCSRQAQ